MKAIFGRGVWGLLILALGAGGAFWLSQSSLLAIDEIEIEGNHAITSEEVMQRTGHLLRGQSLLKPSFDDVGRALEAHPFVESVEVDRDFPHGARIVIREYRPFVNLKASDDEIFILAAEGRTLARADSSLSEFPLLSTREPCTVEIGKAAECPDVITGVRFLNDVPMNFNQEFAEVLVSGGDITLKTRTGVTVHFGSLEEYGLKFEVMRQLLARSVAAGATVSIDVSVPERPVTKDNLPATTTEATAEDSQGGPAETEGDVSIDEAAVPEDAEVSPEAADEPADATATDLAVEAVPDSAPEFGETDYAQTE